jgi:hypothetical protein
MHDHDPREGAVTAATLSWAALRAYYPHGGLARHLVPLPGHGIVYVKNPKAGSSTMMTWLDRLHTGEHDRVVRRMHVDHDLPTVEEIGRRRVVRMLAGAAYRFSFVRHPVARLESVYHAKMVRSRQYRVKAAAALGLPVGPEEIVPFEEFLTAIERQDPVSEMDPHWRPQHLNLLHPLVELDHVGHLETFDADLRRICDEAGLPAVPLESRNVGSTLTDSVYDGRPDLVRRVEALYATDLDVYGY